MLIRQPRQPRKNRQGSKKSTKQSSPQIKVRMWNWHNRFLMNLWTPSAWRRPSCHAVLGQTPVAHYRCHLSARPYLAPASAVLDQRGRGGGGGGEAAQQASPVPSDGRGRRHIPRRGTQCRSHEINMSCAALPPHPLPSPWLKGQKRYAVTSSRPQSPHTVRGWHWHCEVASVTEESTVWFWSGSLSGPQCRTRGSFP